MAIRGISTFEQEVAVLGGAAPVVLDLPKKSQLVGIVDGRVVVALQEPWSTRGQNFATDSLISYDFAEWKRAPNAALPSLVWAPAARQTLSSYGVSKNQLILTQLDNVRGRAVAMNFAGGKWSSTADRPAGQRDHRPWQHRQPERPRDVPGHRLPDAEQPLSLRRRDRADRAAQDDAGALRRVEARGRAI